MRGSWDRTRAIQHKVLIREKLSSRELTVHGPQPTPSNTQRLPKLRATLLKVVMAMGSGY